MRRSARRSSTSQKLSVNRWYSQTAWLMISGGKRWRRYSDSMSRLSPTDVNLTMPCDVIDYLQEENRVLRDQLGNKRLRLSDDQRRRLAVKAKKLGRKALSEVGRVESHRASSRPYRVSLGDNPSIPAARPGWNLWQGLPGLRESDGRRRGQDRTAEPVAESLRGAPDRLHPPRVFGPRDRLQRGITEAYPAIVRRLLSQFPDSSLARQGRACNEGCSAARAWPSDRDAGCRRAASSLHAKSGLSDGDWPSCASPLQPSTCLAQRNATRQRSAR